MSEKKNIPAGKRLLELARNNTVPIMFIIICAIFIPMAGFSPSYLLNEIVTRMGRNLFLVLCLLFPIMAGMGLNFAMTLGAMGAELAIILVADWQIWGIPGVVLAMILSIPFSALLGFICGTLQNMAKGREMITSYIINFFINGWYQLIVLYIMGSIIPIMHTTIMLPRGYGIRNTVSLLNMRQCLDDLLAIRLGGVKIPVFTFLLVGLLCLFIVWFRRTKLGQDMRAVGQDMQVAQAAGLPFIVKGVMTVEGAKKALEAGAWGIVVSNHGGRVLDHTPATCEVLPEIAAALKGRLQIFVDGGVRTGVDVFKMLALGADGVLIGRPLVTAAYGGGAEGVRLYMEKVIGELRDTMKMTGCATIAHITGEKIRH